MDANVFAMAAVFGVIGLISLGLGLVMYIFLSLSLFTLAKRRGILHPGLAWVPVCGARWIMGSLADQYVYFAEGKVKYQRRLLLWLEVGMYVLLGLFFALVGGLVAPAIPRTPPCSWCSASCSILPCPSSCSLAGRRTWGCPSPRPRKGSRRRSLPSCRKPRSRNRRHNGQTAIGSFDTLWGILGIPHSLRTVKLQFSGPYVLI